jgi:hypothetical protein
MIWQPLWRLGRIEFIFMKRKLIRSINVQFVAAGGLHVFNRAGGVKPTGE